MTTLNYNFVGSRQIDLPVSILEEVGQATLGQSLRLTSIGYYPTARHHFIEREEPIPDSILIYCIAGNGWYKIDGKVYPVEPNQCFCLEGNKPHAYGASENSPWTIYWVRFRGSLADEYCKLLNHVITLQPLFVTKTNIRINLFEEIFSILSSGYTFDSVNYATCCLHHLLGNISFLCANKNVDNEVGELDAIDNVIHFLEEHIDKHFTVEDIAAISGYSPTRFSALFKKKTGLAPIVYTNQLKIRFACRLLETTDLKINEICTRVGITDSFYFSRIFTKTMGTSPKLYRRKLRAAHLE